MKHFMCSFGHISILLKDPQTINFQLIDTNSLLNISCYLYFALRLTTQLFEFEFQRAQLSMQFNKHPRGFGRERGPQHHTSAFIFNYECTVLIHVFVFGFMSNPLREFAAEAGVSVLSDQSKTHSDISRFTFVMVRHKKLFFFFLFFAIIPKPLVGMQIQL